MKRTQAQLDAAAKAFAEYDMMHCPSLAAGHAKDKRQAIAAALSAAAEAEEPKTIKPRNPMVECAVQEAIAATIERCAQVAENWTDWHFGPDSSPNETIAAAIRAMKDKP